MNKISTPSSKSSFLCEIFVNREIERLLMVEHIDREIETSEENGG